MIDEPDIIKELREEERIGKLSNNHFDFKEKIFEKIGIKSKYANDNFSDIKIDGYKDALNLAKKVLKNINKN